MDRDHEEEGARRGTQDEDVQPGAAMLRVEKGPIAALNHREEQHRRGSGQEDRERPGRDQQEPPPEGSNRKSAGSFSHQEREISGLHEGYQQCRPSAGTPKRGDPGSADGRPERHWATGWWWLKAHTIPVARYLGKGPRGTDALREKLEVENEGVKIPSTVRWLSGAASVKARYNVKG